MTSRPRRSRALARAPLLGCLWIAAACGAPAAKDEPAAETPAPVVPATPDELARAEQERKRMLDRDFPLHGLVTGVQLKVRKAPDPDATLVGWVRVGARLRLASNPTKTKTCASGWHGLYPTGFVCAGEGIEVAEKPPESAVAQNPPAKDAPLPYSYYFVKEPKVPEYHRLPSRDEQREVRDFVSRYQALAQKSEDKAAKLMRGELKGEPSVPSVVRRFLERGFFVAGAGIEERAFRKFVRAVRGSYVKLAQLEPRSGSSFHGEELTGEVQLPLAWAVREAQPFHVRTRDDGTLRMVPVEGQKPYARLSLVPWRGRERVGDSLLHKLDGDVYVKSWFLAVAEPIARPKGIDASEPWVHVNLDQQTLVAYRGDQPVFATLVSTGLEGHDTPIGLFEIRQKYVANGMADLGPEAGDERYSIDDVPWTQYFSGSIALHGAFWHERFGLRRSHGCVNLAPRDAHRVFEHTWPEVAEGWHGATTDQSGLRASKVLVTNGLRDDDIAVALSAGNKGAPPTATVENEDAEASGAERAAAAR